MRYVVDSNVALKCFLPEDLSEAAQELLTRARSGTLTLLAPDTLLAEVGHSLRREVVRKRLPAEDAQNIWREVRALPIELHPLVKLADAAFLVALDNMGAFYDALYIALAIQDDAKVVTADKRMIRAFARLDRTVSLADVG
jgi:predicted nucleic acid-binding protein